MCIYVAICVYTILGMINILHGLGLRLLSLGYHTPFMVSCYVISVVILIDTHTLCTRLKQDLNENTSIKQEDGSG